MTLDKDSLELAVKLEEQGYQYYKEKAAQVSNDLSKTVLESLAEQELDHKETFKKIAEGKGISTSGVEHEDLEQQIKEVFTDLSDKAKEGWKEEDEEVYRQAIELEKKIYDLYE
jgi:rubrerythrin